MIVLHISIYRGLPYIFSESTKIGDIKDLKKAVKAVDLDIKFLKKDTSKLTAWLPAQNGVSIPSSSLIETSQEEIKDTALAPFEVSALCLTSEVVLSIFNIAKNGSIPGTGIIFGNSILWIGHLILSALKLVINESFIPSILKQDSEYYATWMPVPEDKSIKQIDNLFENAPHVCFCLNESSDEVPNVSFNYESNMCILSSVNWFIRNKNSKIVKSDNFDNIHDACLYALNSKEPLIKWNKKSEIDKFYESIQLWSHLAYLNTNSKYKLYFRLNEPKEENVDVWKIEYLLQPKSDQSLYLTLDDVWQKNGKAKKYLESNGGIPTEFILTALGQASRLCKYVSDSLKRKNPSCFLLNTDDVINFLADYGDTLNAAGFTIILPSWWIKKDKSKSIKIKMKAKSPKMQGNTKRLNLNSLAEFDYEVSLGSESLTIEELKKLAKLKSSLVKIKGKWTQIGRDQLEKAITSQTFDGTIIKV